MPDLPSIIAVDFDGTCVTHEYPKIGREIGAVAVLKELVDRGCKLILWTMRSDGRDDGTHPLTDAVNWFKEHGIPLFGVQRNPEQDIWTTSPKAYAKLYIDDAALGAPLCPGLTGERPFIDWQRVREMLLPEPKPEQPSTFVFLDLTSKPWLVHDKWLHRWHRGQKSWVTARELVPGEIELMSPRKLPPE